MKSAWTRLLNDCESLRNAKPCGWLVRELHTCCEEHHGSYFPER